VAIERHHLLRSSFCHLSTQISSILATWIKADGSHLRS
jgi:hypothetical protein